MLTVVRCTVCAFAVLSLLQAGIVLAQPLTDPFLEKFRVGHYADPAEVQLEQGWPADLWVSLTVDHEWLQAAWRLFPEDLGGLRQQHRLWTWRFLAPALGSLSAQETWCKSHRDQLYKLAHATAGEALPVYDNPDFLLKELLYLRAFNLYEHKRYKTAYQTISRILEQAERLELNAEEVFVWSLRWRDLAARSTPENNETLPSDGSTSAEMTIWPELFDLGPYDAQSAWALWTARQRALGLPVVPAGAGTEQLARFLSRLRKQWLDAETLYAASFTVDATSGLGGVALKVGEELDAHYRHYAHPPRKKAYQVYWLRGQRRRHDYDSAHTEELARLDGLSAGLRLDMWRRASERRLLRGDWQVGLADLAHGLAVLEQAPADLLTRRLREWTLQALVLAVAQDRPVAADSIVALAAQHLHGKAWQEFQMEARYWQARLNGTAVEITPADDGLMAAARRQVRTAKVMNSTAMTDDARATVNGSRSDHLWRLWASWGQGLIAAADENDRRASRCREYGHVLRALLEINTPAARYTLACAAIGRYLRGHPWRDAVFRWTLSCDLARLGGGELSRVRTILAPLAREKGRGGLKSLLDRHALLGVCLATADSRGQLALASALPRQPLSQEQRLLFLYPVPTLDDAWPAMESAQVEISLLLAVIRSESLFDPATRSRAGALGLLQIMPFHYPGRGFHEGTVLWNQPEISLKAGSRLLRENLQRYDGDPYRTVAAYNAGGGAVDRWDRQLGGRADKDIFLAWIGYPETRRYTEKVLIAREIYDWILTSENPGSPFPVECHEGKTLSPER